jgi:glucose-6-phosphate isomerase
MVYPPLQQLSVWKELKHAAQIIERPENHLKYLIHQKNRLQLFSRRGGGIFVDFSRQRINDEIIELLLELAAERNVRERFNRMMAGEKVNVTENRAALHTASRNLSNDPVWLDGKDVMPDIKAVRNKIKAFAESVRDGVITGSTGKPFRHIVVIGIGGSYLGTEFVSTALQEFSSNAISLFFLSNVDIHQFGRIVSHVEPEKTLWIVISKSYRTAETIANARQVSSYMTSMGLDPAKHTVTVTRKGGPGDDPRLPILNTFHMFDFIGGRYSVTSAVGALPLSLYLGYGNFERFLQGAEEMDLHAGTANNENNIPLLAALISIWNTCLLKYTSNAIIPYCEALRKLPAHVQQLYMESIGKQVLESGETLTAPSGTVIFGEPGTNAQHSFFQSAHQGNPFPIDFIGITSTRYPQFQQKTDGITNHQELWANLISQPEALAVGKDDSEPARCFAGNRPSSMILLDALSPENIGRLLSFYEAKTVYEGFIWGINPFDQFGVELGKELAVKIRREMADKNRDSKHAFDQCDAITRFYLETLFKGEL